jgi:anti-sigma factor RsiW
MTTMTSPPDVSEAELHALVDGQLPAERAQAVMAWLQTHPEDATRVAAWQAQRLGLRRLAREQALGDTPAALVETVTGGRRGRAGPDWRWQALVAGVLLMAGWGLGQQFERAGHPAQDRVATESPAAPPPAFVREAALAHAVYTPEKRHPVEVGAAEESHLVQWLSKRLNAPLKIPTLTPQGFQLLGGRLLPGDGAPRAQFMYENAQGERLTLYVTVFPSGQAPTPAGFRLSPGAAGQASTFYWMDERFGYALSAPLAPVALQGVARAVYAQLAPPGG